MRVTFRAQGPSGARLQPDGQLQPKDAAKKRPKNRSLTVTAQKRLSCHELALVLGKFLTLVTGARGPRMLKWFIPRAYLPSEATKNESWIPFV
jgi:hypothetical protein